MGIRHVEWAYSQTLPPAQKATLVNLAWHVNNGNEEAWPSINTIAKETGFDRTTVMRSVRGLAETRLISITKGPRGSFRYKLALGDIRNHDYPNRSHDTTGDWSHRATGGEHDRSHGATADEIDRSHCAQPTGRTVQHDRSHGATQTGKNRKVENKEVSVPPSPPEGGNVVDAHDLFGTKSELAAVAAVKPQTLEQLIELYQEDFAGWYARYPKKVQRGDAERAYATARRKGATADEILAGLRRYRFKEDRQFILHPATWLNRKCWLDEYVPENAMPENQMRTHL